MTPQDRARIARAIAQAEAGTTGRIAVRILPAKNLDALERAKHEFARARLHEHEHANAALVLVAPKARSFAVIGDRELHERVGDAFWQSIVDDTRADFARGAVADGIVHAVERVGEALQTHFAAGESR